MQDDEFNKMCGKDYKLLQLPITEKRINEWKKLECNIDNPMNCVPTSFVLTNLITEEDAQKKAFSVEKRGMTHNEILDLLNKYNYEYNFAFSKKFTSIDYFVDFVKKYLTDGSITLIAYERNNKSGHMSTIAKNSSGKIIRFEGQSSMMTLGENCVKCELEIDEVSNIQLICLKEKSVSSIISKQRKLSTLKNRIVKKPSPKVSKYTQVVSKREAQIRRLRGIASNQRSSKNSSKKISKKTQKISKRKESIRKDSSVGVPMEVD